MTGRDKPETGRDTVWTVTPRGVTFRASVVGAAPDDEDWAILEAIVSR